jgi:cell division protein YceG involved in septum cleavage
MFISSLVRADDYSTSATSDDKNAAKDDATQTEQITFDGQKLKLAFDANSEGDTIKEYIPDGQTLKKWTKLASIREYPKLNDAHELAAAVVREIEEKNPKADAHLKQNDETGETVIDFVVWPEDKSFVEFNVFKFHKNEDGGLTSEQYAVREYKEPERFVQELAPLRERLVEKMTSDGLQAGDEDSRD